MSYGQLSVLELFDTHFLVSNYSLTVNRQGWRIYGKKIDSSLYKDPSTFLTSDPRYPTERCFVSRFPGFS
jgi:hypothetical protein